MKKLFLVSFVMMFVSLPLFAQPTLTVKPADVVVVQPTAAPVADAPAVEKVDLKVEGEVVTVNDVATDAKEVLDAVLAYRAAKGTADKAALKLMFMAILAVVFKFLLSAVKLTGAFWKSDKGKIALRVIVAGLGVGVFLCSKVAIGTNWFDAIVLGLSGPLAIFVHEMIDLIPSINKLGKKA